MRLLKRHARVAAVLLATALFFCGCTPQPSAEDKTLTVTVLGIGAADCILLKTEHTAVMIDCGTKNDGDTILATLRAAGITTLDRLIITHFDKDHIGGAPDVLKGVTVREVIQCPYKEESNSTYEKYTNALARAGKVTTPTDTLTFSLGGVGYTVYPPAETAYGKNTENDVSLVTAAVHGDNRFLFAGDVEADRLLEMMNTAVDWQADFLKVPHHGRYNKRSAVFLGKVEPTYAVITCSKEEPAEDRVLAVLEQLGTAIYQTVSAPVVAVSDGVSLDVKQ